MNDEAGIAPNRIAGPMPCVKCLYDLDGLMSDQKCPECGTGAAETLGSFAAASSARMRRARRGLLLAGTAMTVGPLATAGAWLAYLLGTFNDDTSLVFGAYALAAIFVAATVASVIGWLRIGAAVADPRQTIALRRSSISFAVMFIITASILLGIAALAPTPLEWLMNGAAMLTSVAWCRRVVVGFEIASSTLPHTCFRLRKALSIVRWPLGITALMLGGCMLLREVSKIAEGPGLIVAMALVAGSVACGILLLLARRRLGPLSHAAASREAALET